MNEDYRKKISPDKILERINKENQGKLTVFLGAAAGVGKTYTMLETAHERMAEGVDVIIGWIETHGRAETEKLVENLPIISPKKMKYKEKYLEEMDIDSIIEKKPQLVLVDELAHTNIPGSRHIRRFQDVEELLKKGIDVYTTLNIQHIESLNDIVAQITGIVVRETVPDSVVEKADIIQLIDIPPEELIKRLKEGKVYIAGQAEQALKKFFRAGNINALRELALRFTAGRVDNNLSEYMKENNIEGPWPAAGRVMVCVSASPFSAQLIRATRRLANGLHTDFLAVYIDTINRRFPIGEKERERIVNNLRLAEELGGKTITVTGDNVTDGIIEVAITHNVTAIVVGKPRCSRLWELLHGSVVDTLIRKSGGINVYVIQANEEKINASYKNTIKTAVPINEKSNWYQYFGGFCMALGINFVSYILQNQIELVNIALLHLLPVLLTAFWWGRMQSYFTAIVCVLLFDFLYVPPIMTFSVYDIRYIWSFVIFLVVSFLIGGRTEKLKTEVKMLRQREKNIYALYEFSREISAITDLNSIATKLSNHAGDTLDKSTVVLLREDEEHLAVKGIFDNNNANGAGKFVLSESEYAVAVWSFKHGQFAGSSTDTLPGGKYLYVPLMSGEKIFGVLGIDLKKQKITPEERQLINAWVSLAVVAIERIMLAEQAKQALLLVEADKLRNALFNSISHELRTPLAGIIGAVSTLTDTNFQYSAEDRRDLMDNIKEGATRMERVVTNLLDTARIESGMIKLMLDWCEVEDIIGTATRRLGDSLNQYKLEIIIEPDLPFIKVDFVLLEHVLVNLLDNAMKYSLKNSTISICVIKVGSNIKVTVSDEGNGIPEGEIKMIFEKFYRANNSEKIIGTGLGLSICKSIVEAHNGEIFAKNRSDGKGAEISFTIPLSEPINNLA